MGLVTLLLVFPVAFTSFVVYILFIAPRLTPLRHLSGPPVPKLMSNHLSSVLDPNISPIIHENFVKKFGRSVRIRGVGPWDDRILTLDPVSLFHVMKNISIYEKPWQSRRLIDSLIGCGMLSAEGHVHKRQRRVATPAFSIQNMRALVPLVFQKGTQLKDKWLEIIASQVNTKGDAKSESAVLDVCQWASRATFDVIGIAGFDYNFNAIQDESNEFFLAYKVMFEVCISQGKFWETLLSVYFPFLSKLFPNERTRTVERCQTVIKREAGNLIQEKKRKIAEGERSGVAYDGKDLLTLLLKSNVAVDLPIEQRISDEDILNTINTIMFAGSDTSSLSMTWTLYLLSQNPAIQSRLRAELLAIVPPTSSPDLSDLTEEEIHSLYSKLSELPFLHNVVRESLRLIPPLHSSLRVATKDDLLPTKYPIHHTDGTVVENSRSVHVPKGTFVHVSIEAFNLDREVWGEDAWTYNPDRWDHLPEKVLEQPGLFSNIMSFSAGPRSCIGLRFAMIEIKTFLFILLTNFAFKETGDRIVKANVVLTRPYIYKKFFKGSQLPMVVERYSPLEGELSTVKSSI